MLTQEEIELFKSDWLTFEQIQEISDSLKYIEKEGTIPEKEFWNLVNKDINDYILNKEKCIK